MAYDHIKVFRVHLGHIREPMHLGIVLETRNSEQFLIEIDLSLGAPHGGVPRALLHELQKVTRTTEALPVGIEGDGNIRTDLVGRGGNCWG